MKSFLEDYGLIIVAVIVVLALCVFAKGTFVTQLSLIHISEPTRPY